MSGPLLAVAAFEGPLDVLLALIRKNQLPVEDFPVAEVTRQYLQYLEQAGRMNLELGSEFAYLAATLIQLKSRSLLPLDPELARRQEDPRRELVRQLMERDAMARAASFLQKQLGAGSFCAAPGLASFAEASPPVPETAAEPGRMNLLDVVRLTRAAWESARIQQELAGETGVTVEQMMGWLERRLGTRVVCGEELWREAPSGPLAFLAMLELARTGGVRIEQGELFGPISVRRLAEERAGESAEQQSPGQSAAPGQEAE